MHLANKDLILFRIALLLALVAFGLVFVNNAQTDMPASSFNVSSHKLATKTQVASINHVTTHIINDEQAKLVHAPSITQLASGELIAIWWGGSREGGKDVQIYISRFNVVDSIWSTPKVIQSAKSTQADVQRYITKLGNSIIPH